MFGFGKKKEAGTAEVVPQTVAEEMGLREYVSVDSLKAHLVDMMEENRKKAEKLLKLVAENPELPVLPLVDYEVVGGDWGRWGGKWKDSHIGHYLIDRADIKFKEDGNMEEMVQRFTEDEEYYSMTKEQMKEFYNSLPWQKAIIVCIGTP